MQVCYLFKDRFCVSKKCGIREVGVFQQGVLCTWQLPWLAIEKPWSALAGPFLSFLTNGCIKGSSAFVGAPFLAPCVGSFQSGEPFTG